MPTAHKLPSGSWRCQITVDGKRLSVTGSTKKEAEYKAVEIASGHKRQLTVGITVGEAVRRYIDSRDAMRSPSTIAGYEKILRMDLGPIAEIPLKKFTPQIYQAFVNDLSRGITRRGTARSPKTIYNICGLVSSALRYTDPSIRLDPALPEQRKRFVKLLDPARVNELVTGTDIELPVLLAMWLSLSMSEIRGLTVRSVSDGVLIVQGAVIDVQGEAIHKLSNKEYSRTRMLPLPSRIRALIERTDAWQRGSGYLVPMTGQALYKRWIRMQQAAGIQEPMTFHQLRHLNASIMLALGIPDTYAMERGGWSTPDTLKRIYQHTIDSRRSSYDDRIDDYFRSLSDT